MANNATQPVLSLAQRLIVVVGSLLAPIFAMAQSAPSAYTTGYRYDAASQLVGKIEPAAQSSGSPTYVATRNTYDLSGRLIKVETGYLSAWQAQTTLPANWSGFTVTKIVVSTYDIKDRKLTDTVVGSDLNSYALTQYSYDGVDRLLCTAVRMNPSTYGSLPSSACTQGTAGNAGPDQITQNVYDAAGQLVQVQRAVGTSIAEAYATYAYGLNGEQTDAIDANGNHTYYVYDGFDRKSEWVFPSPTAPAAYNWGTPASALASAGLSNSADYEGYGYDANGNRTSLKKRDGTILTYQYDALDRVIEKIVPQRTGLPTTDARSVFMTYDLVGHVLTARFDSASGDGVTNTWDGLGRQTSSTLNMDGVSHTLNYQYDADSNRIQVTHPDGNYVTYVYDGMDRASSILRSGSSTVASFVYNPDGTRASFNSNGSAVLTTYGYDAIDRLSSLANNPSGNAAYNNQYGFSYSPANQLTTLTKSNNAFIFAGIYNVNRPYSVNGLNQYKTAGSASFSYDANANLTSDGQTTFLYDVENRMVGAGGVMNAALRYDPMGRLYEIAGPTATTRMFYDGDALVAEYDQNGNLLRRYVHGADEKADNPIAWYEGAAFTSASERFLRPDWQGSISLATDTNGSAIYAANTYDEYGIPGSANVGRFQYTGQAWIPELGMYYYKARMYSPTLGRFMQTDPIGYKDNINLYAYVGDDPMDKVDFTGLYECSGSKGDCGTINGYVNTAQTALKGLDPKSDAAKKLGATLSYLGKAGEKNGVTITSASLGKNVLAQAGSGGNIQVDIKHINAAAAGYAGANSGMSAGAVRQGFGAGALAHEARHELDFSRIGFPNSKAAEYRTELNAYRTEQGVGQGLNMNNGIYTPGATQGQMDNAVRQGAQSSTDYWCSHGGPC